MSQAAPGHSAPGGRPSLTAGHYRGPAPPEMRECLGRQPSTLQMRAKWPVISAWEILGLLRGVLSRAYLSAYLFLLIETALVH